MSFSIEDGCATLRGSVTLLRQLVEKSDSAKVRFRPDEESLSALERIVGLFKYESDYIRPSLALLLGQEMRRLPTFDLTQRAAAGAYGAYNLDSLLMQWAETRNISVAKIGALDESFLSMRGKMPACNISVSELLEQWLTHEAKEIRSITTQLSR